MRKLIFIFFLFAPLSVYSSTILDLLEEEDNSLALQKQLKKDVGSLFPSFRRPDKFIHAFESGNFQSALDLWPKSVGGTSLAKSPTGEALYSYLLFKNGYEVLSLRHLFKNTSPNEINPIVSKMWKVNIEKQNPVWNYFFFPVAVQWHEFFSAEIVFKFGSKDLLQLKRDQEYIKSLLSLPLKDQIDVFPVEWSFVLSLIRQGDMNSATKILSYLIKKTKDQNKKDMLHLTIARLLANIGETKASLYYYAKLNKLSYLWLFAQEEQAWVLFNQGDYSKAHSSASAFEYLGFKNELSPSMLFILALSQLKNCDYKGSARTLSRFKLVFSKKSKDMETILKSGSYENLKKDLLSFYHSGNSYYEVGKTDLPYSLRGDSFLRNHILLADYMQKEKTAGDPRFKTLDEEREGVIRYLKNEIHGRMKTLLEKELKNIQAVLDDFQIIEAEVLYRKHGFHSLASAPKLTTFSPAGRTFKSLYKSDGFLYFPFDPNEVWLDELSDYKGAPLNNCPRGSYVL